jgi:2-polyprenyl-3-methyl-5-hydroxy-6-metoxy-1,4-benzoquinol methylase
VTPEQALCRRSARPLHRTRREVTLSANTERIRADFDRIATLPEPVHDPHPDVVLRLLGPVALAARVLDVGCGRGTLARRLVAAGAAVHGVDLSPVMIAEARRRCPEATFEVADVSTWSPPHPYDAVVSAHALHHLPTDAVQRMADWVRPGGRLVVYDLCTIQEAADAVFGIASMVLRTLGRRAAPVPAEVRAAWDAHMLHDRYFSVPQLRRMAPPGARVRRHLYWRASIVWDAPLSSAAASAPR